MVETKIKKIQDTFTIPVKRKINHGGCGVVADGFRKLAEANGKYTTIWLVERSQVTIPEFFQYRWSFTHIMIEIEEGFLTDITGTFPITDFNVCDRDGNVIIPSTTENDDNWYVDHHITKLTDEEFETLLLEDSWNPEFVGSRLNNSGQLAKTFAKQIMRNVTIKMLPESELYVIDFDSES